MNNQTVADVIDYTADLKLKGFNVFESDIESSVIRSYSRKDFYKICLVTTGKSNIQYADKEMKLTLHAGATGKQTGLPEAAMIFYKI